MNAPILDKIKKLLRLSKSDNPHEAELALQNAWRMAARHKIDLAKVDLDDEECERIVRDTVPLGISRLSAERERVMQILASFFHVEIVMVKQRNATSFLSRSTGSTGARFSIALVYLGKPTDIALARYTHDFLLQAYAAAFRGFTSSEQKARRKMTPNKRKQFCTGFFYGLASTLKRAQDELVLEDAKFAIVLRDEKKARQEARDRHYPEAEDREKLDEGRRNDTAIKAGYKAGRETKIHQPVKDGTLCLE